MIGHKNIVLSNQSDSHDGPVDGAGGFELDRAGIEALERERAVAEEEEVMRREADAYIEEEEEAMRELQTNALPEGSVLERRKIDKDLTLSINKREGALHGTSGSGSMKRNRDDGSSFSSLPSQGELMMFIDSDDDD